MKTYVKLLAALLLAVAPGGCRVNNGDIGPLFGSWLLEDMTVDGEHAGDAAGYSNFWSFQNNIVEISLVDTMYDAENRFGTWTMSDDVLLLDFTHSQLGLEPGTGPYRAPEWLGFPYNSCIALDIMEMGGKRMTLGWCNDDGVRYIYSLKKIW